MPSRPLHHTRTPLLAMIAAGLCAYAASLPASGADFATTGSAARQDRLDHLLAAATIADARLDTLRGGFETPGGLQMRFGIERVVLINGVLHSTTSLRLDGPNPAGGQPAAGIPLSPGSALALIQSGPNNISHLLPANSLATIVQNSLDNQKLQTITTISATVNSLEVMQGVRMEQAMQEAVTRAAQMR
ncbi:hypothetical protein [Thauera sp. SDU_THAU2]|uniref:hypothetical protein n=1 Tax=Thauera sp. SDU_THAU2 TaxID=3136633 RepID=UPI00311D8A6C